MQQQRYSLGGAGSVLANLRALGVKKLRAVGLIGEDIFGDKLRSLLCRQGADTSACLADPAWQTMVYAKPMFGDREDSRLDFGAFNEVPQQLLQQLLSQLTVAIQDSDVVILNQQVETGLSSVEVIEAVNGLIARHENVLFLADARHHANKYRRAALKLNIDEAARWFGKSAAEAETDDCAQHLAVLLNESTRQPAFLTRGEKGMVVAVDGKATLIPGIQVNEKTDAVGAGDAVVAALAASLAAGASPVLAAATANVAAMITVKKLQTTGTASATEIQDAAQNLDYVFRAELANSPRKAQYVPGTEIEVVNRTPADLAIKHCIFDHDGTLSVLREGWEHIMEPMMMQAILGAEHDKVSEQIFQRTQHEVKRFIDRTTGIQTLVQMKGLISLVREAGFVTEAEVLDEHGYKAVYNEALLAMVKVRVEKLRKGELESKDFQVKNAAPLLRALYTRGVKLYLASGTDEADVIAEAEAMGYADCFEGRIFGAVGDINVEAKKMVLERIIRENDLAGHEFAVFGDGPVELREGARRGGLCVGVASDEVRRFGLNLSKRKRLIRAGADLIVPDFSQLPQLLQVMNLQ